LLRYIVKGLNRDLDSMDKVNNSTALHVACDMSSDLTTVQILVEGGANVNAVNNDNWMPLSLIRARLKDKPDDYDLQDIEHYLRTKGAQTDWRTPS
jgi:hypothetical protein